MDRQRPQSAGNHATDFAHVELQRTVSIGRFFLPTHFTHPRSWSGSRPQSHPQRIHGTREITGPQEERHQDQEQRRTVLRTRHRHHESLLRLRQSACRVRQSTTRSTRSRSTSPRASSPSRCSPRTLRVTRTRSLSTPSRPPPTRRLVRGPSVPDHLQGSHPAQTDRAHQRRGPLPRL